MGSWSTGKAGFIVAPYDAISVAGDLGCQPATVGRFRTRVASTVTPRARAQTHSMAGAELVIVRKCPRQSGTVLMTGSANQM